MKNPLLLFTLVSAFAGPAWAQGPVPPLPRGGLAPGLYVQVIDGLVHLTNPAGTLNFAAGQFGYTSSFKQPPVMLPTNPGIPFTQPPSFSMPASVSASNRAPESNEVMCIVR